MLNLQNRELPNYHFWGLGFAANHIVTASDLAPYIQDKTGEEINTDLKEKLTPEQQDTLQNIKTLKAAIKRENKSIVNFNNSNREKTKAPQIS